MSYYTTMDPSNELALAPGDDRARPNLDAAVEFETPLARWMRETNTTAYAVFKGTGISYKQVCNLRDHKCLPGLVTAYKLDLFTKGKVAPVMWLATPLADAAWKKGVDMEKYLDDKAAEQKRNRYTREHKDAE